jgi:hypothetical protein
MSYKVDYSDFNANNIIFGKIDEQQTESNGQKIKYYRIPIEYAYDIKTKDGNVVKSRGPLYINGPKQTSRGPQTASFPKDNGEPGKIVHSIMTRFDLSNSEHVRFVNRDNGSTMHDLAVRCAEHCFDVSDKISINCSSLAGMMDLLHYPIKWKLEKGRPVPGVNPAAIWKLFRYGKDGANIKETSFYLPVDGGRKIAWDMISNNNIEHKPLFRVNNITIAGGRPSIKIDVVSSIVLDILPGEGPNLQQEEIDNVAQDSFVVDKLMQKIRELEMEKAALVGAGTSNAKPPSPVSTPASLIVPGIIPVASVPEVVAPAPAPITLESIVSTPPLPASLPGLSIPGVSLPGVKLPMPLP